MLSAAISGQSPLAPQFLGGLVTYNGYYWRANCLGLRALLENIFYEENFFLRGDLRGTWTPLPSADVADVVLICLDLQSIYSSYFNTCQNDISFCVHIYFLVYLFVFDLSIDLFIVCYIYLFAFRLID